MLQNILELEQPPLIANQLPNIKAEMDLKQEHKHIF